MKLGNLFDIKYGINLELNACEITDDTNGINFVARTSENNGIVAKVKPIKGKVPQPAGVLTCAAGGSVLSTFVQPYPFYSGRDLYILTPKEEMSLEEKLFYCHAIKMNAYRYQYGRQANRTLKDIDLPPIPAWLKKYKIDFSKICTKNKIPNKPLQVTTWEKFKVADLFTCQTTKALIETEKGSVAYVTRSAENNGISGFVKSPKGYSNKGDWITIGAEGKFAFFQENDFVAGVKVYTLRNSQLNKYNGLFVCTVLNLAVPKYSYGRARILDKIKEEIIMLPSKKINGNQEPDWQFMENYIRNLPYGDLI